MRGSRGVALVAAVTLAAAALTALSSSGHPAAAASSVDWGDWNPAANGFPADVGPVPAGDEIHLYVGMTADTAGLDAFATAANDPRSPSYGQRVTLTEARARFGASDATRSAVLGALAAYDPAASVDPTGSYVTAAVTAADVEQLFSVELHLYAETPGGTPAWYAPTTTPSVPAALDGQIVQVAGVFGYYGTTGADVTRKRPKPVPATSASSDGATAAADAGTGGGTPTVTGTRAGCPQATGYEVNGTPFGLTPNQLLTAYGIGPLHDAGLTGAGVHVALVENGSFLQSDLDAFLGCFGISATPPTVSGPTSLPGSAEPALDVQMLSAIAPNVDRLDVLDTEVTGDDPFGGYLRMFAAPLDPDRTGGVPPDVVSVSYALCEAVWPSPIVGLLERVFATAAAMGVTYVAAAGDVGSTECAQLDPSDVAPTTSYPATSRWVTAVGGTNLTLDAANHVIGQGVWNDRLWTDPSFVVDGWGGGGGYSTLFRRPAWQDGAVSTAARGVPDVAFYADLLPGFLVYCTNNADECPPAIGPFEPIGGTSSATPLFAGVVALLTQWLRATGQPTPGFVTPLLYAVAQAAPPGVVRDVTAVNNVVFATDPSIPCCTAGPGWDAASGWGSMDAAALQAALEPPRVTLHTDRPAGVAPVAVTLTAEVAAPAGAPLRYAWDLNGDGVVDETTETNSVTATFSTPGVTTPRVTVTTTLGRRGSADATVAVQHLPTFTG